MGYEKPNLLVVSGFGDKGISELAATLNQTGAFSRTEVIRGCPWWHAGTTPRRRISAIEEQLTRMERPVVLIGHSYGALLALAAACRRQLVGIHGIFINGPLNANISVEPPHGKALFHLFALHYRTRENIARECMNVLQRTDKAILKNCVTIVSPDDNIVSPDAQKLPDILPSISLPREIRGHSMSLAKIAAVSEIVTRTIHFPKEEILV